MGDLQKIIDKLLSSAKQSLQFTLGLFVFFIVSLFFILSIPVYIYRQVVLLIVKLFKPDFGSILHGMSAALANDFFSNRNPRASLVFGMAFEGTMTEEEIVGKIEKTWMDTNNDAKSPYCKFHQFPSRYMGFTFWKEEQGFNVADHVSTLNNAEHPVTETDVVEMYETLLNKPFPKNKSPWHMYIIENYQPYPNSQVKGHKIALVRWHHLLADAMSMTNALLKAFANDFALEKSRLPKVVFPKQSSLRRFLYVLKFPFSAIMEFSTVLMYAFVSHPLKIKDTEKTWKQYYARSALVPVQKIKEIKNKQCVSFTSVLISAISKAVSKHLEENTFTKSMPTDMLFGAVLPISKKGKHDKLTNYFTTVTMNMKTCGVNHPFERLHSVNNEMIDKRHSVLPMVSHILTCLAGNHLYPVTNFLFRNRFSPTGTNLDSNCLKT